MLPEYIMTGDYNLMVRIIDTSMQLRMYCNPIASTFLSAAIFANYRFIANQMNKIESKMV